jgi:hypothetical protein
VKTGSAMDVRFVRLLTVLKRNISKLDRTDREIVMEAWRWFYLHHNPKGPRK